MLDWSIKRRDRRALSLLLRLKRILKGGRLIGKLTGRDHHFTLASKPVFGWTFLGGRQTWRYCVAISRLLAICPNIALQLASLTIPALNA